MLSVIEHPYNAKLKFSTITKHTYYQITKPPGSENKFLTSERHAPPPGSQEPSGSTRHPSSPAPPGPLLSVRQRAIHLPRLGELHGHEDDVAEVSIREHRLQPLPLSCKHLRIATYGEGNPTRQSATAAVCELTMRR